MKVINSVKMTTLDNGNQSLNVIFQDDTETEVFSLSNEDTRYSKILEFVCNEDLNNYENVEKLYEVFSKKTILKREISESQALSENFEIKDNLLYYGEKPLESTLLDYVLSMLDENGVVSNEEKWEATVRFIDNLHQNTSEAVRSQLFRWLSQVMAEGELTITKDGCFLGYKGCRGSIANPKSISTGTAYVNGEKYTGSIPNPIGATVTMPRAKVTHDPQQGCSAGLHVGTYEYAHQFSHGVLLLVKVNPRDVVSVPYECDSQKLRCCEYKILEVIEDPIARKIYEESLLEDEENFYDEDDYEDEDYYEEDEEEDLEDNGEDCQTEDKNGTDTLDKIQKVVSSIRVPLHQTLFRDGLTGKIVTVLKSDGTTLEGKVVETEFPGTVVVGNTMLFAGDVLSVTKKD